MKFGKRYTLLLPSFPEEWQERAISYGQLKKLINNVVDELSHLGLDPVVLNQLLSPDGGETSTEVLEALRHSPSPEGSGLLFESPKDDPLLTQEASDSSRTREWGGSDTHVHAAYEIGKEESGLVPRLKLWVDSNVSPSSSSTTGTEIGEFEYLASSPSEAPETSEVHSMHEDIPSLKTSSAPIFMASTTKYTSKSNPLYALQKQYALSKVSHDGDEVASVSSSSFLDSDDDAIELLTKPDVLTDSLSSNTENKVVVVSLSSDAAFYQLLSSALTSLAELQETTQRDFTSTIDALSLDISRASRPSSRGKSDLYVWRLIFQLWVEAQIFESSREKDRGERDVEEVEARLSTFANEVVKRGLGDRRTMKSKESRAALERFLQVNVLLLDLKKFQRANAEAARKIIKKHEKRTSLMIPPALKHEILPMLASISPNAPNAAHGTSLAHMLVVLLTETLLPVIPSIDDYACLICTSIAYTPIRLQCSHLFCVRCLVKMQRRGAAECPLCRSPSVLQADRSNVDHALKRFMHEWFPQETKEKEKANEREAAEEELKEMGFQTTDGCIMM